GEENRVEQPPLGVKRRPFQDAEPCGRGEVRRVRQLPRGLVVAVPGEERGEVGLFPVATVHWSSFTTSAASCQVPARSLAGQGAVGAGVQQFGELLVQR